MDNNSNVFDDNYLDEATEVVESTDSEELETEVQEEVAQPDQQEGENQENDETPASTESEPDKESEPEESWTKAAVLDERRKRQELEKENRELKARFNQPAQQEVEEEIIPDPIDDPVGYKNYVKDSLKQEMFLERVNETKAEMQAKHEDYSEMESKFIELSNNDSALALKLRQVANPAKFAYETAKNYLETQKFNDPNYKAQLKEELRKEILADLVKKQKTNSGKSDVDLPANLSNASSIKGNAPELLKLNDNNNAALFENSPF